MLATRTIRAAIVLLSALLPVPPCAARAEPPHDVDLVVVNHARRPISELYVSPTSNNSWGDDRLGDAPVDPGHSTHVRLGRLHGCDVDIQVVYDDASQEERHGVDACHTRQVTFDGSATEGAPGDDGAVHQVVIVNDDTHPIQQLLISSAQSGDWGDDLLTHDSLSVGDRITVPYRGSCLADVRVVFDNEGAEERRDLDLCALGGVVVRPGWTTNDALPAVPGAVSGGHAGAASAALPSRPPPDETVDVTVTNHSGGDATGLFIFPEGSAAHGPNLLAGILPDGGQAPVTLSRAPGQCRFAARVAYGDKAPPQDVTGLDLCRDTSVTLPPRL